MSDTLDKKDLLTSLKYRLGEHTTAEKVIRKKMNRQEADQISVVIEELEELIDDIEIGKFDIEDQEFDTEEPAE